MYSIIHKLISLFLFAPLGEANERGAKEGVGGQAEDDKGGGCGDSVQLLGWVRSQKNYLCQERKYCISIFM